MRRGKHRGELFETSNPRHILTLHFRLLPSNEVNGPRGLTRAILSNKGLTPHRVKSVRNPRVKKRQRFEKAQKRMSSKKATYKGGLAETGGRYEGEKSGISSRVIKSVKL
jgi:U3 small nucleolar RNA-associated protein 3